ncbi:hypothetical protein LJR296_001409 [Cupriavidus necator]|uniref:hypothetical protein n=1 Tax=Cupriavidus necator TaxID=106590 RepID=UPI003ECC4226
MSAKQKPCTLAPKHKWEFVRNVTLTKASYGPSGSRVHISYRGQYKCACGEKRIGQSQRTEEAA